MAYGYVKFILYAYPHLGGIAEAVGTGAENRALLSFRARESAYETAVKIVEELANKSRLLRLEAAVDGILQRCSREELFLLEYKYFRRRRRLREEFAGMVLACSERNYFRRQEALLRKVAAELARVGWTEEIFMQEFGAFETFRRPLAAFAAGQERRLIAHRTARGVVFCVQKSEELRPAERLPRRTSTATRTAAPQRMQMTTICTVPTPSAAGCGSSPSSSPETASR